MRGNTEHSCSFSESGPIGRETPTNPLVLRNSEVEVIFDGKHGLPYSYRYREKRLWGENEGKPLEDILCRLEPRNYQTVTLESSRVYRTPKSVQFDFHLTCEGRPAADLRLRYALEEATLVLTMERVKEQPGFALIEAALPQLVTVREEDGSAWMAEGRGGGSFVRLEEAKAFRFPDSEFFGRISTELPIGMVGQNGIGCVMEVTAFMDGTETEIRGDAGHRCAMLGTVQTYRVHGGRCYGMNDGGPPVCGNANTPNLIACQTPRVRLDFFSYAQQSQPWITGAKIVRQRVPDSPTHFFPIAFYISLPARRRSKRNPEPPSHRAGNSFAMSQCSLTMPLKLSSSAAGTTMVRTLAILLRTGSTAAWARTKICAA